MAIIRLIEPAIRCRNQILRYNNLLLQQIKRHKSKESSSLSKAVKSKNEVGTSVKPFGEKVKETTKTASYLGIILLGVGVTGTLFYAIFNELFSSNSPNSVYSKAAEKCKSDPRIQDKLGLPIKAFGEESRRGRRQHASHARYERDGRQCIRMKFYLKGTFHDGTAHLEMCHNDSGRYEYRYLFVQVNDLLNTTIILDDNRSKLGSGPTTTPELAF